MMVPGAVAKFFQCHLTSCPLVRNQPRLFSYRVSSWLLSRLSIASLMIAGWGNRDLILMCYPEPLIEATVAP
jgi:hypothetical protein